MSNSDAPGWPSPTCSGGDLETHTKRLNDAVLDYANLQGADFSSADLRRAWMQNCKSLEKADLRGAKLLETRVVDTTLDGVDLEEADFEGAYLIGVDLSSVYNLDKARLQGARYDDKVVWPAGFDHWSAGARPIGEYRNSLLARLREENKKWHLDTEGNLRSR